MCVRARAENHKLSFILKHIFYMSYIIFTYHFCNKLLLKTEEKIKINFLIEKYHSWTINFSP